MKFRKQREAITKGKIFFHCGDAPRDASHHNGIPCLQTWEDVNFAPAALHPIPDSDIVDMRENTGASGVLE